MMCYSFTLASSCLLLNIRWTCWILSVHVLYDRVWSFYLVQSHVLFRTRDTSFTICSHRWCLSWFILVLLWTTRFFVVFFSQYHVVWGNLARPLLIFSACCYLELCEVIKTYPFVNNQPATLVKYVIMNVYWTALYFYLWRPDSLFFAVLSLNVFTKLETSFTDSDEDTG